MRLLNNRKRRYFDFTSSKSSAEISTKSLLEASSLSTPTSQQSTSFRLMDVIKREDWKIVSMIIRTQPNDARKWTNQEGFYDGKFYSDILPIHQACTLQPTRKVIEDLYKAYPNGFNCVDSTFKRTPLHLACQNKASLEVIQALLECNTNAAHMKDALGRIPLHYVCMKKGDRSSSTSLSEIVMALVQAYPASVLSADRNGWLPLHVGARFGMNESSMQILINANKSTIDAPTSMGSTASTIAEKADNLKIVRLLEENMNGSYGDDDICITYDLPPSFSSLSSSSSSSSVSSPPELIKEIVICNNNKKNQKTEYSSLL